jgi:hypothetical protein
VLDRLALGALGPSSAIVTAEDSSGRHEQMDGRGMTQV